MERLRRLYAAIDRHAPAIAALLVIACFMITRLPFFFQFPLPDITVDYWSYWDVVDQARHGHWPKLLLRTPGYPMFIAFVMAISRTAIGIAIAQALTTLVASIGTLACFVRAERRLAFPVAVALIGFTASMHSVFFDTMLMSESLYCSLLMLAFGAMASAILRGGMRAYLGMSLAMGGCTLVRPAALFFLGTYAFILAWMIVRRVGRRRILAFALPFASILLLMCGYNRATIGAFVPSPFGEQNLFSCVATYIEEDPTAPPEANAMVREIHDSVTPADRNIAYTSRDPDRLFGVFVRYYDPAVYTHSAKLKLPYMEMREIYGRFARLAIRRHPGLYFKFVLVNTYEFFRTPIEPLNLYRELVWRYERQLIKRDYFKDGLPQDKRQDLLMEYWDPSPQSHIHREGVRNIVDSTGLRRLHEKFDALHVFLFSRAAWIVLAIILFPISIWRVIRSRVRDLYAWLAFLQLSALLGSGLLVGLLQQGMFRYGATSLFITYLSLAQLCLLAWRPTKTGEVHAAIGSKADTLVAK
jgi:hypothetical protein